MQQLPRQAANPVKPGKLGIEVKTNAQALVLLQRAEASLVQIEDSPREKGPEKRASDSCRIYRIFWCTQQYIATRRVV